MLGWCDETPDLHRAPAGGRLRDPAEGGVGHGRARLRRVFPVRSFPGHGRPVRPARPDGLLGDTGWPRLADEPHPAWHHGDRGHLPAARAAGHLGGPGRPDERRPRRIRLRHRVVRAGAHRVRDPVPEPEGTVRPVRGAARDHHRALGDPAGQDVFSSRRLLSADRLSRAAQAGPAAEAPGHPGRGRPPAHAAAGGPVRGRVQPGVQEPGRHGGGVQPGSGGPARKLGGTRPRSGSRPPRRCAAARTRRRWPAAPRPSGGHWRTFVRTA